MKKIALILWVGLVLLAGSGFAEFRFVSQSSASPGSGFTTWTTAGHTIQSVLDVCAAGDIVYVDNGIYTENVSIPVELTIESWCAEPADCIISAPDGAFPALTIPGSTHPSVITIRGFTIQGGSEGILIHGNEGDSTNLPVISGCIILGYTGSVGIHGLDADFIIEFSTIINCRDGLYFDSCGGNSEVRCNIIAYNSRRGITQSGTPLYYPRNNCYYLNTEYHIYGFTVGRCDQWCIGVSGTGPGVDPLFVDYAGGDFHLQDTSPCIDFVNSDPDSSCHPVYYDMNETSYDLGAYGGYGVAPTNPAISSLYPASGATRVAQNTAISFTLQDVTAGMDLDSLVIRLSYTGYEEFFDITDCTYTRCEFMGLPPTDCGAWCYNITLPGTAHAVFHDYALVRVDIDVDDLCPSPNHLDTYWSFRADDIHPPVMLDDHFPPDLGTDVPVYGPIDIGFTDSPAAGLPGSGVNRNTLILTLNGTVIPSSYHSWASNRVRVYPEPKFIEFSSNTLTVSIRDNYNNVMPLETIQFTTRMDDDAPFVPGVSLPTPTPTPVVNTGSNDPFPTPTIGPSPSPVPSAVNINPFSDVSFSIQDFETVVDVSLLQVQITRGSDVYIYTQTGGSGYEQFQVQGSSYCRRITCHPPNNTWLENQVIYVTISGARDSAGTVNVMSPVSYSFTTGLYAVPVLSPSGIMLLLMGFGVILKIRRRRRS